MALLCFQGLLGSRGLMNANQLEQQAAILSLATLMSIAPGDTYLEFEKVLKWSLLILSWMKFFFCFITG